MGGVHGIGSGPIALCAQRTLHLGGNPRVFESLLLGSSINFGDGAARLDFRFIDEELASNAASTLKRGEFRDNWNHIVARHVELHDPAGAIDVTEEYVRSLAVSKQRDGHLAISQVSEAANQPRAKRTPSSATLRKPALGAVAANGWRSK